MTDLRRTGLALALGAAAAVVLPAAAHADEAQTTAATDTGTPGTAGTAGTDSSAGAAYSTGVSPASPLDLLLSTPGDVIGTLASGSPV